MTSEGESRFLGKWEGDLVLLLTKYKPEHSVNNRNFLFVLTMTILHSQINTKLTNLNFLNFISYSKQVGGCIDKYPYFHD